MSSSSQSGSDMQLEGILSTTGGTLNGMPLHHSDTLRQTVYDQQQRISHPEVIQHVIDHSGYHEQDNVANVEICTDKGCQKLDEDAQ